MERSCFFDSPALVVAMWGAVSRLLFHPPSAIVLLVKQLQKPLPLQGSSPLQDPEAALTRCRETMEEGEKDQDTLAGDAGSKKGWESPMEH